jgi:rhomboid protease GluP
MRRAPRPILIDLNHILLFIAIVSPLILLGRIARLRNPRNHGWRIAAFIVLAGSAISWFFLRPVAGFISGTLWCLLLVIPSITERKIDELLLARRFAWARRLAVVRRILHPWEDSPHRPSLLRDLELASAGRLDLALDRLAQERAENTPAGRYATALTFALTENWPGLLQWCRRDFAVTANPAVLSLYLRALGETGARDDLVLQFVSHRSGHEASPRMDKVQRVNLAVVLAFCGRTNDFVRLMQSDLSPLPRSSQQFWRATAELAEGQCEAAIERLGRLRAETPDALLRCSIERRLAFAAPAAPLSPTSAMFLDRLVAETIGRLEKARPGPRAVSAVWALLVLNALCFGLELIFHGTTDSRVLGFLGALEPVAVIDKHEYWRLLSATFLHYGALHLTINLFALYILGPPLERLIGSAKFIVGYLLSGLGSSVGVVLLTFLGLTNATQQLVGASGAIMGVVGISAGLLLRHRQSPLAGRQLQNILVIVAIQTLFDLWTPQVSLAAHLCGFLSGVGVGVIFASRARPQTAS